MSEVKPEEKTKITFELESPTEIKIMRDEKQIGQIYSQHEDGCTPYPHNKNHYCLNAIQICGWDKMDGPWGCGPFRGHKDLVVHFRPTNDEYFKDKAAQYKRYCTEFMASDKNDPRELQSFQDWIETFGAF